VSGGALRRRAKALIRKAIPPRVMEYARELRKKWRHKQWEERVEKNPEARYGRAELVAALRALGVESGRDTIVHSAMSRIGFVDGGADTVVDALIEVVGPRATLLMPVYPMQRNMTETMQDPTPFDVANDKSYMGKITDIFRQRPGVLRSAHPTHSVAALGPDAAAYTAEHHKSGSPCGPGSPFRRLSEKKGQIVCIGTGVGKVTSHHTVEDLIEGFPIDVYVPTALLKRVRFPDGHEEDVGVRVHKQELALVRIDNDAEVEKEIHEEMRRAGLVKEGKIGLAEAQVFGAAELDRFLTERLARLGTTIYRKDR
jgi:aminoglycoside 3-N-acetyltransferase